MVRSRTARRAQPAPRCRTFSPAQEPFYKGKRLTLLVNFDAGSATDIDARVSHDTSSSISMAPCSLSSRRCQGGGEANGTMYLGEVAPKDGSMVDFHHRHGLEFRRRAGAVPRRLQDLRAHRLHAAAPPSTTCARTCRPASASRPTSSKPRDWSGGVNARTGRDISIRLTLDVLGVPFRHVTGYGSGERARLALQRQEIHLYADTTPGYRGAVEGTLVKDGTVIPALVRSALGRQDLR